MASLLDDLLKGLSDRINWTTLSNSNVLTAILDNYKALGANITQAQIKEYQDKVKQELELHKSIHPSVIKDIEEKFDKGGITFDEAVNHMRDKLGVEITYLQVRKLYTDLKRKLDSSGEAPDAMEKQYLKKYELMLAEFSADIDDANKLWRMYKETKDIQNGKATSTVKPPTGGSNGNGNGNNDSGNESGSNSGGSNVPTNTTSVNKGNKGERPKGFWGQGDKKNYLGMSKTNNTFSGVDMVASINIPGKGPVIFGELAQLSYSVYREKMPVRSLGRITAKGYTRGQRTITGILVFNIFDQSIVYECMKEIHKSGYRMLMDEMPVFDVTVTMSNEYGHKSSMTIYGISTYTEGQVMGVNNLGIQNAYEFYAIDIDPVHILDDANILKGASLVDSNGNIIPETLGGKNIVEYYDTAYNKSIAQQGTTVVGNRFKFT